MMNKRLARLSNLKSDENRVKFGTFIGRSLVDGTAIVRLDGDNQPTSGFKLISNANVANGDRVAVRKTNGLWRVDAQNVREVEGEVVAEEEKEFVFGSLGYIGLASLGNTQDIFIGASDQSLLTGGLMPYLYDAKSYRYVKKDRFNISNNDRDPIFEDGISYEVNFKGENNYLDWFANPAPDYSWFGEVAVFFKSPEWDKIFLKIFDGSERNEYFNDDFFSAPIEVDISINSVVEFPSLTVNKTDELGGGWFLIADTQFEGSQNPRLSFRYRKRGNERWFSLK